MQEDEVLNVPVPSLIATLLNREQAKGSPLTQVEVEEIRDTCPCIAMTPEQAKAVEHSRGYTDLDAEWAWEQWQEARKEFDDHAETN